MRASTLEECDCIARRPNHKPVSDICHVAFMPAPPFPMKDVHVMSSTEFVTCFFRIGCNQFDHLMQVLHGKMLFLASLIVSRA